MNTYGLATIVKNEKITAGIWKMELAASEIAYTAEPGQFIMLYPPDKRNLLARPISLSAISEKSVTIVYRIAGKGTKQFSQLQKNDSIRIMGPLGNGFTLPDQATKSIVVGGGLFGFAGMLFGVPTMALVYYLIGRFSKYMLRKRELPEETTDYVNLEKVDLQNHTIVEHSKEYEEQTHVKVFSKKKKKASHEGEDTEE